MSSRLQRQIERAIAQYATEPLATRERIERALRECGALLMSADDAGSISDQTKAQLREAVESIAMDGFMGGPGGWRKVHAALAAAAPALYAELRKILPGGGDQSLPF